MLHLGNYPWTSDSNRIPIDPATSTNIPTLDKQRLQAIDPVPILGFSYSPGIGDWPHQTPLWLAQNGFRQATVRLQIDGATSDNPQPISDDAEGVAASLVPSINNWLAADVDFDCVFVLDNEPNLERSVMQPAEYVRRANNILAELKNIYQSSVYPGRDFVLGPLAQNTPNFQAWFDALAPEYAKSKYLPIHFYFNDKPGDKEPGIQFSPEWWAKMIPNVPVIVCETGSKGDRRDVEYVFTRWASDPRILRFHWWKMSGESYAEDNFDVDMTNIAIKFAKNVWRRVRQYPLSAFSVIVQPPTNSGNYTTLVKGITGDLDMIDAYANRTLKIGNDLLSHILKEDGTYVLERSESIRQKITQIA